MPRPPRLQFADAIYHIVTRGDGRRALFHNDGHYGRLTKGLADEVMRSDWEVIAYCWMPNHIHLLVQTPRPNLAAGMQHWLSGYANWYAKRNRRTGHLFQGRYKSFLVENESYFWTLSRYIHLNACSGSRPLVDRPEDWQHSSYPGYARKSLRNSFVQYDRLYAAWQGEHGGSNAAGAYRRFVQQGLSERPANPLDSALREWVIGSAGFLKRMVAIAEKEAGIKRDKVSRKLRAVTVDEVIEAVAALNNVDADAYVGFRSQAPGRELAALLCRRHTSATLAELSARFGLSHPDSSANLIRRSQVQEKDSSAYRTQLKKAESQIMLKTENQV